MKSVMKCEISVITMTLLRLDYLIYGLGNYVDDTPTETLFVWVLIGISINLSRFQL